MQVESVAFDRRPVIASGWACDLRILPDGRRQIFAFLLPGDTVDLARPQSMGGCAVVALTQLILVAADAGPDGRDAGWESKAKVLENERAATRQEQLYNHLVRIGCLTARERVVNLLLELRDRLDRVGLVKNETFKVPVTQEVLADCLGLSVVHINRTLRELRDEGLLFIKAGSVTLKNLERLRFMACFECMGEAQL